MKPTPRSTWPATLTSLPESGSAGAAGAVETPSGPLMYVAIGPAPPDTLLSCTLFRVRVGDSVRSVVVRPSVWPGPEATCAGEPTIVVLVGLGIRPAGRLTLSIGRP